MAGSCQEGSMRYKTPRIGSTCTVKQNKAGAVQSGLQSGKGGRVGRGNQVCIKIIKMEAEEMAKSAYSEKLEDLRSSPQHPCACDSAVWCQLASQPDQHIKVNERPGLGNKVQSNTGWYLHRLHIHSFTCVCTTHTYIHKR